MARKPATPAPSDNLSIDEALNRAYAHWNAGQTDQAELFCQRVLAAWPGQADALHLMGVMAHAFGNLDLALQHVRQACQAPRAPAVYFSNLAEMCRQKGLLEEGEQAGRRAVALAPNMAGGWNNLGIILQEAGKLEDSAACLERVVALQPDYVEAHNNLGNTFKRMGRLDKAAAHYDRALTLAPNYAEAHSNLSNLLCDLGQFAQAAERARRAIDINPQFADAYINLASVGTAQHRHGEALRWLDSLLAFAPGHAGALSARAKCLKQLDRMEEALDAARRAVAAAPHSADVHNALGEMMQAANRFDEALACFDKAAQLPGTVVESAHLNRATLLAEIGRGKEALAVFDEILAARPHCAAAWHGRADLKKFSADDPDIARMEALLSSGQVQSLNDRMSLHFSLGKAYMDAGDSARAFHHLGEGNRMKRATFAYDAEATGQWMQGLAKTFSAPLFKKFKDAGNPSDMPIFVLGMPRSGTTLVEQILASHPQVHGAGELRALQALVDGLGDYPAAIKQASPDMLARLGEAYVARVAPLAQGRRHVVDKMPANFLHAGLIRLILPNARIVHCRRDPVDTCLSCYTKLFGAEQSFTYDLAELGAFHRAYQALTAHWRKVLPQDRFIEVDYEAVVDDLEGQARRLVDFLGLPWDDACLKFHETTRPVRTASVNQVRQPIYKTSAGRWRKHAAHLQPLLKALGVDPAAP
ncbi:MAG TPA: sulfotransferase [Magnetospirillum sp.]|jgi:tetratricopeptide (TPR) repeat protein|nr:sulfotransferase [Magnetospirillum sp.]